MSDKTPQVANSDDLNIIDDLSAPTIVVDGIAGIMGMKGVVTFGLTQGVLHVESKDQMVPAKKVVLRLAIPEGALENMVSVFQLQLERMGLGEHPLSEADEE